MRQAPTSWTCQVRREPAPTSGRGLVPLAAFLQLDLTSHMLQVHHPLVMLRLVLISSILHLTQQPAHVQMLPSQHVQPHEQICALFVNIMPELFDQVLIRRSGHNMLIERYQIVFIHG